MVMTKQKTLKHMGKKKHVQGPDSIHSTTKNKFKTINRGKRATYLKRVNKMRTASRAITKARIQ
jgi:hypothetical protein